jgi:hypothetical protein
VTRNYDDDDDDDDKVAADSPQQHFSLRYREHRFHIRQVGI